MKIVGCVVLACAVVLAGCGSSGDSPSATPASSEASGAADTFTMRGQVVLGGRFTGTSTEQGSPCAGSSSNADLKEGAQVVVSADGGTVALGTITDSFTDYETKPGLCALGFTVDDVPGGLKFYSVKIGEHDAPELSEADARQTVKLNLS